MNLIDQLPCKQYSAIEVAATIPGVIKSDETLLVPVEKYFAVSEVAVLLEKLSHPKVITKVIRSITFGQKLTLDDVLKDL